MKAKKVVSRSIYFICLLMAAFQIYISWNRFIPDVQVQCVHLAFVCTLVFLISIEKSIGEKFSAVKILLFLILLIAAIISCTYLGVNYFKLVRTVGRYKTRDLIIAAILIPCVFVAAWKIMGKSVPILTVVFIAYMFVGPYLPGILYHGGFSVKRVLSLCVLNFNGVFGSLMNTCATFIMVFMLFGGLLGKSRAGKFFMDFALSIGGKFRAGPALTAVISSAMMGSINGSAVANVSTTGVMTIPIMKERGYEPAFAGAVEATASTGGMLLPPVMGVSAFVMAEIIGVPYIKICACAAIPAIMYYILCASSVIFYSGKKQLQKLDAKDVPSFVSVMKDGWYFLLPVIAICYFMIRGYSTTKAGMYGIGVEVFVIIIDNIRHYGFRQGLGFHKTWKVIGDGLVDGVKSMLGVTATIACIGMMVQCMVTSDFINSLVSIIMKGGSSGLVFVSLLIAMAVALILGCGIPATACYIMMATMVAPSLIGLGFNKIAVHLFCYYYTVLGSITPPVGQAALVASRIAGSKFYTTCTRACRLALSGLVLPFLFIYHPEYLCIGKPIPIILTCVTGCMGLVALGSAIEGYFIKKNSIISEILLLISAVVLIYPFNWIVSICGAMLMIVVVLVQVKQKSILVETV